MPAYDHARARACACICLLGESKYVHVHDEIILLWRLSTPVLLCVRHIIVYRMLDRKCISPQHFCSSFFEILHSTELLRKFREIVMSFFRKQSTQTCANGFSNIGEFCKIVTLLMSEWQACICCYLVKVLTQQYIQYSLYHVKNSHITLKLYFNTGSFVG
jgi:hypothetical protein